MAGLTAHMEHQVLEPVEEKAVVEQLELVGRVVANPREVPEDKETQEDGPALPEICLGVEDQTIHLRSKRNESERVKWMLTTSN